MYNPLVSALNNNETFIRRYNLLPNIAYLTLLYYQFSYLKGLSDDERNKENIVCSFFESNYQSPHVVIVSHYKDKKRYTLRRIRLLDDVYKDLAVVYKDTDKTTVDDDLVKQFTNLYDKYNKGEKHEQLFC